MLVVTEKEIRDSLKNLGYSETEINTIILNSKSVNGLININDILCSSI